MADESTVVWAAPAPARLSRGEQQLRCSVVITELAAARESFARLTYPRFASCLTESGGDVVAIGALAGDRAVGLALARLGTTSPARLLSLNVEADWRRCGIGRALLATCEDALRSRGAVDILAIHSSRTAARECFERTLAAAKWQGTQLAALRVTAHCGPMQQAVAAWPSMRRLLTRGEYGFTPWADIDANDREAIEYLCSQPACRNAPGPMPHMALAPVEPTTSLVIRRRRQVVGWVITERQQVPEGSPASIDYVAGYVDTALWRTGIMIAAHCAAFARQATAFGPLSLARFETTVGMPGMFAMIRRRLAPLAMSVDEVFVTRKHLPASAPDDSSSSNRNSAPFV